MIVMDRSAARLLFLAVWVCSVGAIGFFTLAQFGWLAAVAVAVPMTIVIGAITRALLRASEVR